MRWNDSTVGINEIMLDPMNISSATVNILDNHGEITLEEVMAFEAIYINADRRRDQDIYCMHRFIIVSLSKDGLKRVKM